MFLFVIRYFGFLKAVPVLAMVYDSLLKLQMLVFNPAMLKRIDDIEATVSKWEGISTTLHKYGGLQFNYRSIEIGHIHSNGVVDILLNKQKKQELIQQNKVRDHHTLKNTRWISFYIKNEDDMPYATELLKMAYQLRSAKNPARVV